MKPDELFEMLTDIDEKFIDDAMPESKNSDVVQPQKIQMTKRRFPWGIATAACLAVCVAVGAVVAVNAGKSKIPFEPNSPCGEYAERSYAPECIFDYSGLEESELPPVEERHYEFTMPEYPENEKFYTEITALGVELYVIEDGYGIVHLTHYGLNNLYLYDFDNDGKREICMTYYDDQVPWRVDISVYDPEDQTFYCTDPGYIEYSYCLVVSGDKLMMEVYPSSAMNNVPDSDLTSIEPLSLKRVAKDAEEIYTGTETLPLEFIVAEANLKFEISENKNLSLINWGAVASFDDWYSSGVFSGGVTVRSVYLCDLNGDGYREIAAAVTAENGDTFVKAYNAKAQKEYEYKPGNYESRWHYNNLTIKDGSLYLCTKYEVNVDEQPLTLDIMTEVNGRFSEQIESVYDVSTAKDFVLYYFHMPEYSGCEFKVDGNNIVMNQNGNTTPLIVSPGISKVWLSDLNGDGKREIITECENSENSEVSFHTLMVYDLANSKRYAIENSVNYSLGQKDGVVYITYAEDDFLKPLTLDIMKESAEFKDYGIHETFSDEKLEFTVDVDKSAYKKGEIINLTAKVSNLSDKTFYIVAPTSTRECHEDIKTNISLGVGGGSGSTLIDIDAWEIGDCAMEYIPVKPGESYSVERRFDTANAQTGVYQGVSGFSVSDNAGYNDEVLENYSLPFFVTVY